MLRSLLALERYTVTATDGDIGKVVDFLLDDERWVIRYLVVDADRFLERRSVLISPISFGSADWTTRRFNVMLTTAKVNKSPGIETDLPVSRQFEKNLHQYYGYPYYWGSSGLWGMGPYPRLLMTGPVNVPTSEAANGSGDAHLRSANEVHGYHVQGSDRAIGHVDEFLIDDETWAVRYLAIDTRNWWYGRKVLVAPPWASRVSWAERKVYFDRPRQKIKDAPEWDGKLPLTRDYEARLHEYFEQPTYRPTEERPVDRAPLPPAEKRSHR
jgi:hypothetical protein